jgi:hypothetical protein
MRAGFLQQLTWAEWNQLPARFAREVLETWNLVVEIENQQQGTDGEVGDNPSNLEASLINQSKVMKG